MTFSPGWLRIWSRMQSDDGAYGRWSPANETRSSPGRIAWPSETASPQVPTGGDDDRFLRHRRIAPSRGPPAVLTALLQLAKPPGWLVAIEDPARVRATSRCGAGARCRRAGSGPGQVQARPSGGRPLGHPAPADRAGRGRRLPARDRHPRGAAPPGIEAPAELAERALRVPRVADVPARPSAGGRQAAGRPRAARHAGPDRSCRRAGHAADCARNDSEAGPG